MRHLLRRLIFYLFAAWATLTINFFLPRLAPGDPLESLVGHIQDQGGGNLMTDDYLHALQAELGYGNDPLWQQYLNYFWQIFHGNLGISVHFSFQPVVDVIRASMLWTIGLGLVTVLAGFALGCLIGIIAAWKRGTVVDIVITTVLNFIASVPYFWLALVILYVFGSQLRWFPVVGGYDTLNIDPGWTPEFWGSIVYHSFLPSLAIVLVSLGGWMLTMRNSMISTLSEDYILMARAKGLKSWRIMMSYAARNAILPNIAGFAISIGSIVSGQLLTEMVFSYPGVGYTLLIAVNNNDYALIQGIFLFVALAILITNFLADLCYTSLDPRIRDGR